jgi:hypothetical protein
MKNDTKRFTIDLPAELHQILKLHVLRQKTSMKEYVEEAIVYRLIKSRDQETFNSVHQFKLKGK